MRTSPLAALLFGPLLIVLQTFHTTSAHYRKSYVIERNETWGGGHEYLVREEQPFFRVYHMPHQKVFRESPTAGKLDALQWQLIEQQGSAQRLQEATEFWRKHHKGQLLGKDGKGPSEQRKKRAERTMMVEVDEKAQGDQKLKTNNQQQEGIVQAEIVDEGADGVFWTGHPQLGQQRGRWELKGDSEQLGKWMAEGHWDKKTSSKMGRMEREELRKKLEQSLQMGDQQQINEEEEEEKQAEIAGGGGGDGGTPIMKILERNRSRASAKFGHHHLPSGERKDTATWPWQLWPFMSCLSLECTCPLFRGSVEGHLCILPNGKPLKRAIRKELRQYTHEEMALFVEVMRRYKSSGLYTRLGMIHRRSGVHSGPSFFPWHREFLKRLEIVFRALFPENTEPVLGLPYWDSSLDGDLPSPEDSVLFSDYLLGEADDAGFVFNGLFANWTTMDGRHSYQRMFGDQQDGEFMNEARIDWVLSQEQVDRVLAFTLPLHTCINYQMDERFLEYSHDYVHYFISGDMQERFSSSNDPIFFMHHGFIDSVWEEWRQTKQTRLQRERDYPRDDADCMPEWHFSYAYMPLLQPTRNMDALSNNYTDHMYEYARRPSCAESGTSSECGNTDFVWCDTRTHPGGHPVCSSKVKPGGNCKGFEWSTEICYKGKCIGGRCSK
uniref:Tyrosinase copper-binding domain-containing protein n=1 Tax=Globodera rostochiensis TaxID=31243 RepID=A0A914GX34_GLORO